jgi:hypothetical protein
MKIYISWHVTSCSSLKVNRRFRGTYRLHLQARRISQTKEKEAARSIQQAQPEDGRNMFVRNVG